jgi:hypothetical protein
MEELKRPGLDATRSPGWCQVRAVLGQRGRPQIAQPTTYEQVLSTFIVRDGNMTIVGDKDNLCHSQSLNKRVILCSLTY